MNTTQEFELDCHEAFDHLRAALLELYASVGADPANPQDVARRFKVNKTLTWNLSKVMAATDPLATVPNVPGASALKGLLKAVEGEGARSEVVERVRAAAESLDRMVELHVGDRATLQLVVDGMSRGRGDHLELSRKLAFRGNSGMWGVQAKTRLMTVFLAPSEAADDRVDIAIVRGFVGFRRLRTDVRWPIFQVRGWGDESDLRLAQRWHPLDAPTDDRSSVGLLRQFSTVQPSDLEEVRTDDGIDCVLGAGPIGNSAAVDCFVGDCERSVGSRYRTNADATGEFGATISAPTERLIFDLIVHESLAFALKPEARGFGGIFMGRSDPSAPSNYLQIPMAQTVALLPGKPPVVATPSVPRYSEIVTYVHDRMGWNGGEFRGCRLDLSYPPMGSTILLSFALPEAPTKR